jgi:hypothetical protein
LLAKDEKEEEERTTFITGLRELTKRKRAPQPGYVDVVQRYDSTFLQAYGSVVTALYIDLQYPLMPDSRTGSRRVQIAV